MVIIVRTLTLEEELSRFYIEVYVSDKGLQVFAFGCENNIWEIIKQAFYIS